MVETEIFYHGDGVTHTYKDGTVKWYKNGKLHKEDGPAITFFFGQKEWWINGQKHRDDGPAIIKADGSEYWLQHGKPHREDGPAVIYKYTKGWYLDGEEISEEQFKVFVLQKELNRELSTNPNISKKIKL
jgi:hypothetical protein